MSKDEKSNISEQELEKLREEGRRLQKYFAKADRLYFSAMAEVWAQIEKDDAGEEEDAETSD